MERADRLEEETRQLILNNTKLVKERSLSLQELHAAQSRLQDDKAIKDEMEEEERRAGVNLVAGLRRRCEILENENNELKTLVVANEDSFKQTELGLKAKLRR